MRNVPIYTSLIHQGVRTMVQFNEHHSITGKAIALQATIRIEQVRKGGLLPLSPNSGGKPLFLLLLLLLLTTNTAALAQSTDWAQWGGPHRNFKSETKGLATTWPATGPRRLWQRELGEGYSAVAVERGTLFTMYRKGENEIVIALD